MTGRRPAATSGVFLALLFLYCFQGALAKPIDVPPLTGPVVDQAGLLSHREKQALEDALQSFFQRTQTQFQVLLVNTMNGASVEDYSIAVVEKWKLGGKETDRGLLLLLSVEERAWRIEVGQGLEGDITDALASRIGRGVLVPLLRQQRTFDGISGTLQALAAALGQELNISGASARRARRITLPSHGPWGTVGLIFLFMALTFIMGLMRALSGRGSWGMRRRGGDFWGGGWGGGGWRGGGWSSGGWGGGGGGFSGGGASGRW